MGSAPDSTDKSSVNVSKTFIKIVQAASGTECASAHEESAIGVRNFRKPSSCAYDNSVGSMDSCPVKGDKEVNPLNNMPKQLAAALPPEAAALNPERVVSTIPMSTNVPHHQKGGQNTWVYPSEQMFYAAMKRKGWEPETSDMKSVVAIHNAVNERAWQEVLVWEKLHSEECDCPKLKKFMGRPNDLSPKARFLNFLGFGRPFDRHDWVVDRCGEEVRYIIDFYNGSPVPGIPAAMFIDARPALDSIGSAWDRMRLQFKWVSSGRWMNPNGVPPPADAPKAADAAEAAATGVEKPATPSSSDKQ